MRTSTYIERGKSVRNEDYNYMCLKNCSWLNAEEDKFSNVYKHQNNMPLKSHRLSILPCTIACSSSILSFGSIPVQVFFFQTFFLQLLKLHTILTARLLLVLNLTSPSQVYDTSWNIYFHWVVYTKTH